MYCHYAVRNPHFHKNQGPYIKFVYSRNGQRKAGPHSRLDAGDKLNSALHNYFFGPLCEMVHTDQEVSVHLNLI